MTLGKLILFLLWLGMIPVAYYAITDPGFESSWFWIYACVVVIITSLFSGPSVGTRRRGGGSSFIDVDGGGDSGGDSGGFGDGGGDGD